MTASIAPSMCENELRRGVSGKMLVSEQKEVSCKEGKDERGEGGIRERGRGLRCSVKIMEGSAMN
jgi:hypothetical protein